jgi:amino acid permease
MCIIYLFFYRALKAQGIDRSTLPYIGWFQPYCVSPLRSFLSSIPKPP